VIVIDVGDAVEDWVLAPTAGQSSVDSELRSGSSRIVKQGQGVLILDKPNTHGGGTAVETGEVIVRNAAALGTGGLSVRAGARITLDIGDADARVASLTLDEGGVVDLGHGGLIVSAGGYSAAGMRASLTAAFRAGWRGMSGLITQAVNSAPGGGLGYVVGPDNSLTVAFAAAGDSNLDGLVDVLDVVNIVSGGYFDGGVGGGWSAGDFNYDGVVDVLDISDFLAGALYNSGTYGSATASLESTSTAISPIDAAFAAFVAADSDGDGIPSRKTRVRLW